jgi:uncharacterized protein with PQ loop repeat
MSSVDALGLLASVVFLVRLLPQPVRLARRPQVVAGVSALAALQAVVAAGAWVAYGLDRGLPVVWGVSVAALVPCLWQLALVRRVVAGRDLAWCGGFVAVLVAAWFGGLFAVALSLTAAVTLAPQVRTAVTEHDLSGLAPATWWVAIVDASVWGAYGLAVGDRALLGYFAVLVTASVVVLGRIAWTGRAGLARMAP